MSTIPNFKGNQFTQGSINYGDHWDQYATSTYSRDHDMHPGVIAQPADKEDIKNAIAFAKKEKKAIAIRTGGHQYSGASSTGENNILLDLSKTFRDPSRDQVPPDSNGHVFTSISWSLGEFNAFLGQHNVFVPHGQCTSVHLGGHVQTGGYGQLARSFGLLGDHVISLDIIDHEGNERKITKAEYPDLFFAWLGGSPGNLGVLTHITVQVHRDADYIGSRGLTATHRYKAGKLQKLLGYLAEMNDQADFPRNYDLCISVMDFKGAIGAYMHGMEKEAEEMIREEMEAEEVVSEQSEAEMGPKGSWFRGWIVVYAQWVPFSKDDKPNLDWFKQFQHGALRNSGYEPKPMSKIMKQWIFQKKREFNHPYVKRAYVTESTNLSKNDWVKWVVDRMKLVLDPRNDQFLVSQIQCLGGQNSQLTRNAGNGTAYSWRGVTTCMVLDNFHVPEEHDKAEAWQATNDTEAIGPNGRFSSKDMRFLWGSHGGFDLDQESSHYFDQATYERVQKARKMADPDGVFTPNTFAVKRAE